ncbi:Tetratricopeptide repeat (TPR)-like superfamily protein isoform 1 [Tripterygium wilfordii]|uniref:Tetratricopeptide repeat (TPR)-like superfamily protein isoform 1 n=1 Tax=Tripterygium wilfordii TaxID=458696 RepID=A0A7J7DNA1_TRIWF|nr:Tetratricopeptide repeat (TPR)-like superfamily protein isoform 1 [Tripterygium wilfordii]
MVDPYSTPLGRMLLEEITPVVMVLQTPLVEESCLKNSLSFIQMLSPFCNFTNIDVPVRTASDQPYRLHKFKLRLSYATDIRQLDPEVVKEQLKQVISQAGEKDQIELPFDPPNISDLLSSSESEIVPSWFQFINKELIRTVSFSEHEAFDHPVACSESEIVPSWFQFINKELIRTVSFSEHEAFDHPVACLLVVSSKDEQPINRFVDLFNTHKLPFLLNDGAMGPKILKYYLLVHDNQDGSLEKAAKIFVEMRNTFGSNACRLLCINSSQDGLIEHHDNPWSPYKSDTSSVQKLGCFLNIDDFNEIKDFAHELSSKHIIPYMEEKIRVLNQQVSATRKGLRNQIKNLWWRKGKEEIQDSPNAAMYTFSSIESQIRVLGDYAFMLRDYELALSNYRLISTDYKLDKAWKHYAGVQEMIGLTYFMMDQSRKEAEYCMENAFNTYLKIGSSGRKNAVRCGLWWVEMLKARDQYKEAATVYFRICGEEPLHSALMLEQASYCYLLSKPPMLHKYGFHLVLSGDRYKKCDQIKHAIRTYRVAISVYKGTTWSYIKDHVHFHIGQWYALLEMYDVAVSHMLDILACGHQSKTTQELFLKEFIRIVQKTGKTIEVSKLQLPAINASSLKVIFEDHRTYASPAAVSVGENLWHALEEEMIPSIPTVRTNWLEAQSRLLPRKYIESNVCVAGEPIKVGVEFRNPLQISISISSVSLMCELSARSDETNPGLNSSGPELQNDEGCMSSGDLRLESSSFTLSEADITLGGAETVLVELTVTPTVEGILKIVGVRWKLSDSVVGLCSFESNTVNKKVTRGRRKSKQHPSNNLKFVVVKSLPRIEGSIHPLPEKAYVGDIRQLVLELRNGSEFCVKNLKMKISNPRFLCVGCQEDLSVHFPACLEESTDVEQSAVHAKPNKMSSNTLIAFPEEISVQGEKPFLWPLWLRAATPGNICLHISIYYEIGDVTSAIRFRTLRMRYNLQVFPSLDVSFKITPCPSKLEQFLVCMDVVNRTSSKNFQVHQLSAVGHQWEISSLQPMNVIFPSQSLNGGQACSCFFILKSRCKSMFTEDKTCPSLLGTDVRLGPQGDNGVLFDISRSPLADFHNHEKLQQGVFHQVDNHSIMIKCNLSLSLLKKIFIYFDNRITEQTLEAFKKIPSRPPHFLLRKANFIHLKSSWNNCT